MSEGQPKPRRSRFRLLAGLLAASAAVVGICPAAADAQRPQRVVSLDYCADQYLLGLADREQILAVSQDADKEFSALRGLAEGVPQVRNTAEDVLALDPDLVLRTYGGGPRARAFFERLGIPVHQIGYVSDFEAVARETLKAAEALGRPAVGRRKVERMRRALTAAGRRTDQEPLRVLYVTPKGVTAGAGTMIEEVLTAAGFVNLAAAGGKSGWRQLPLERLVTTPPDLYVTGFFDTKSTYVDRWTTAGHPAVVRMFDETPAVHLDGARLSCAAWFLADTALDARQQADALFGRALARQAEAKDPSIAKTPVSSRYPSGSGER